MAETVMLHLRLNKGLVKEIDKVVKENNYNSRTEFLSEAAKREVEEKKIAKALEEVKKHYGEGKRMGIKLPSEEEMERIRQNVWHKLYGE